MKIALVGPCSPADLASHFDVNSQESARDVQGYRGVPVSELAKALLNAGHDVSISSLAYRSITESKSFSGPGVNLVVHPGRPRARQFLRDNYRQERGLLAESVRDFAPDIVHGHWTYEFALGALDSGAPCAITAHDSPYTIIRYFRDAYRTARLLIAQQVVVRATNLSAVSPYLRDRWRTQMLYRRPIQVIPNSTPTDTLPSARLPTPYPTIISVGDSSRLKNIPVLLKAFATVRAAFPTAELRVIGPGLGVTDDLAAQASHAGLTNGVKFVGLLNRQQLADEYSRAWLIAHPSLEECCPMVLLEALVAGVPALGGSASGGVPYVLDEGRQGQLCDIRDPEAIAESLMLMIKDGVPTPRDGAQEYVDANFSPRAVAASYIEWYEQILRRT